MSKRTTTTVVPATTSGTTGEPSLRDRIRQYDRRTGNIEAGGLVVRVRVTDIKVAYGTLRLLVTPVTGSGEVWVNADRFSFIPPVTK